MSGLRLAVHTGDAIAATLQVDAPGERAPVSESAFRRSLSLLGTKRLGTVWFGSLLSNIGTWAQQVAQPWLLLNLGASSLLLWLDAFAKGAPVLPLTLVGGLLADRADRRRVVSFFQSIQMLCPALTAALSSPGSAKYGTTPRCAAAC